MQCKFPIRRISKPFDYQYQDATAYVIISSRFIEFAERETSGRKGLRPTPGANARDVQSINERLTRFVMRRKIVPATISVDGTPTNS